MIEDYMSLYRLQVTGWLYLAVITIVTAITISLSFALSVFVGGVISMLSFWASHTDIIRLVSKITESAEPEQQKEVAKKGRGHYLLKFWIRIAIIGIVLLVFIKFKNERDDIFGLILGLSTVVFTITFTVLNVVRHYFFSGRR